ncbi:MAG TPA: gamma-glutamyltransferase family protein [Candidatus Nitrosocosmicus sp.]|jgi:gamma-glutamyltranspeptidase/glutathione hydrolase|nr:gamma-glutamyltransferase family protein [Candidatus Nitrosocosmicus sp.]
MSLDAAQSQKNNPQAASGVMNQVMGRRWMVAAGHPLAAQAAARILEAGGNAIDAGAAAGMMLGVVHPDMVSFAGVGPLLVHVAKSKKTYEVSGVGPYPRLASAEYYRTQCGGEIPVGLLRTVVPATPDAWCTALARWGTKTFAEVAAPAYECAKNGYPVSTFSAAMFERSADKLARWPSSAAVYLPGGKAPRAGQILVERELAATIKLMMDGEAKARRQGRVKAIAAARDVFYRGEIARRIAAYHEKAGGLLRYEDLAEFAVEVAPALKTSFHEYEVATSSFYCQGPVLLQMLNLLEGDDLAGLGHNSPRALHLIVEAMKLAFADREAYYGDPRHVKVPADGLLSKVYAKARRALIHPDRAWPGMPPAGDPYGLAAVKNGAPRTPPGLKGVSGLLDTSYVCVVDEQGNGFSSTPSDPCVDSPVVPGVGCVISPRGSQGWLAPGHPSEVAPGKRPRLTPAPAMAFKNGKLFMPFGTPGGDVQQQAMLQVFLNVTAYGMPVQRAIDAPRLATRSFPDSFWPHPDAPGVLEIERRMPAATRDALAALGHQVSEWPEWDWRAGAVCAIVVGPDGTRHGGADPRRGAHAIGW